MKEINLTSQGRWELQLLAAGGVDIKQRISPVNYTSIYSVRDYVVRIFVRPGYAILFLPHVVLKYKWIVFLLPSA